MNRYQTFKEFLATQSVAVPLEAFALNLVIAALLSFVLSYVYIRHGTALSDRRAFSRNFILITMTTMLVITIVKSSLALSLGLVGALSIVRFRTAIKDPEELSYLFLAIGTGVGLGADQRLITVSAFFIIMGFVVLRSRAKINEDNQNLFLTITSPNIQEDLLEQLMAILKNHCSLVNMKRFDETRESTEAVFFVEFENSAQLIKIKNALRAFNKDVKTTFVDTKEMIL